ncbi:MAG: TRL-like family protein [Leptospira sp.]|nr:TRL-like family protein [Leptospira sp.]
MRNILTTLLLCAGLLVSCASPGFGPNGGLFSSTTTGVHGANNGAGAKVGQACASSILGFIGVGGETVANIAASAGITNIKSVNLKTFSILGLYANLCTVVTGD